jgi:hypothetical protein
MMTDTLRIFLIIGITLYFMALLYFLRKSALTLKYTLLWFFTGFAMLAAVLFPAAVEFMAKFLGIYSTVNAVFALAVFFLMIILVSITSIVSKQSMKNKTLIQTIGLLEKRIRELEDKLEK